LSPLQINMNTDEFIAKLPNLPLKSRGQLPEKSGIYYVIDDQSIIWYIGLAKNLRSRWAGKSHHRIYQLEKQRKKVFTIYYEFVHETQLDASSRRLGRNVDLVQMHWSTANYAPWQEVGLLDGLGDLYEQGLVKGVGLSNYGTKRLLWVHKRFQERGIPIKTLQVQYSLLSTYPVTELGLREVCDDLGIALIAYSPLGLGLLTGKFSENGSFPKGIRGFLCKQLLPGMKPLLGCLQEIANTRNKTMSQVAINWCISKGTIPIPGAKSGEQAKENIGALGWFLSDGEVIELDHAADRVEKKMVQNIFQTR